MLNLNVELSTITLDRNGKISRKAPRKKRHQQHNYMELFDHYTLFSDIFFCDSKCDSKIELLGPPLLNLRKHLKASEIYLDDVKVLKKNISIYEMDRISRIIIKTKGKPENLKIKINNQEFIKKIQPDYMAFFENKNVLVTQQRNNPIEWILYWIIYHIHHHEVDAVLIYDNNSDLYTVQELQEAISLIDGIERACIVDWKIPYGPTGGPKQIWDSDYGQHQFLDNALNRLLRKSNCAIIGDIDELPLHSLGTPIPQLLQNTKSPILSYNRIDILNTCAPKLALKHSDTFQYYYDAPLISPKYSISPKLLPFKAQLLAHNVNGIKYKNNHDIISRHFNSLRLDWRNANFKPIPAENSKNLKLMKDYKLIQSFNKVDEQFDQTVTLYHMKEKGVTGNVK